MKKLLLSLLVLGFGKRRGEPMKRCLAVSLALVAALAGVVPSNVAADSGAQTFELVIFTPNMGQAPNGDRVAITGGGTFSIHPKSVDASGEFTHTDSDGNVVGTGAWEATKLLAFHSYGCGEVLGNPLPPNFCGGMLKMEVLLTAGGNQFRGILTIFCIVGPNPPNSHDEPAEEGATLNIPGAINFNQVAPGGTNIFIKMG